MAVLKAGDHVPVTGVVLVELVGTDVAVPAIYHVGITCVAVGVR